MALMLIKHDALPYASLVSQPHASCYISDKGPAAMLQPTHSAWVDG